MEACSTIDIKKEAGRIRHLGFSSHASPETLERFLNWYDGFEMAQIQLNYLDWTLLNAKRQYEILTERGIQTLSCADLANL